jgi:hypothetical protein
MPEGSRIEPIATLIGGGAARVAKSKLVRDAASYLIRKKLKRVIKEEKQILEAAKQARAQMRKRVEANRDDAMRAGMPKDLFDASKRDVVTKAGRAARAHERDVIRKLKQGKNFMKASEIQRLFRAGVLENQARSD